MPLWKSETPRSAEIPAAVAANGFRSVRKPWGETVSAGNISR